MEVRVVIADLIGVLIGLIQDIVDQLSVVHIGLHGLGDSN